MSNPPYPGQGNALPGGPYKGEWIIENKVFLVSSDLGTIQFVGLENGEIQADGFNAVWLAKNMGITVEELFRANREGTLRVTWESVPAARGVDTTLRYSVQTLSHGVGFQMSTASIKGRA